MALASAHALMGFNRFYVGDYDIYDIWTKHLSEGLGGIVVPIGLREIGCILSQE